MSNVKLLDCTLRDGGYVNDWNFGFEVAQSLVNSLVAANIDFVELGFLQDCIYDANRTLFNNIAEAKKLIPKNAKNTQFILMALHNKYNISKLEYNDGTIFAIRVTFHNYDISEGLDYIRELKSKGYNVFCNPINIMGYSSIQFRELIEKVNQIKPYAFSIVDTFGSMRVRDLLRFLYICDQELDKEIVLGCHLHENMSLALSLAESFAKEISASRKCTIDASLFGMGRPPGNLCIELMANYLNESSGCCYYSVENILEAIDSHILNIKLRSSWGYSPEYFLSAKYNLHRNYAEYYCSKGNMTYKTIDKLLSRVDNSKKAAFDALYAEEIYDKQFYESKDDFDELKKLTKSKKILILAPGASVAIENEKILCFINENEAEVFGINFISELYTDINVFFGNERRFAEYLKPAQEFVTGKLITTSNVMPNMSDVLRINYKNAASGIVEATNSVLLLINLLYKSNVTEIYFAGLDGYKLTGDNYLNKLLVNRMNLQNIEIMHDDMVAKLKEVSKKIKLHFVTESAYMRYL